MTFSTFLAQVVVNPGKAFHEGVGKFTAPSIILGCSSGFAAFLLARVAVGPVPVNAFDMALSHSLTFFTLSLLLHIGGRLMRTNERATYVDFLSIFGFTFIPRILYEIIVALMNLFLVGGLRDVSDPGLMRLNSTYIAILVVLSIVMHIAEFIYRGLALIAVYGLSWRHNLLPLALTLLLLGNVNISFNVTSPSTNANWEASLLMVENVRVIDVGAPMTYRVALTRATPTKGELVHVTLDNLYINTAGAPDARRTNASCFLEIMALPGDTVELIEGSLFVNGALVRDASAPLPHLSLAPTTLLPDEFFVYVRSPEALGVSMSPSQFIVTRNRISWSAHPKLLDFLQAIVR